VPHCYTVPPPSDASKDQLKPPPPAVRHVTQPFGSDLVPDDGAFVRCEVRRVGHSPSHRRRIVVA
jgi:hypothetical protein